MPIPPFQPKHAVPVPAADAALGDRPALGGIDRLPDVLAVDVLAPDVVESAVVGFADQGVDRSYRLVALDSQGVGDNRLHARADRQRVRQDDGCLDRPQLLNLGRAGELTKSIADKHGPGDLLLKQVAPVG